MDTTASAAPTVVVDGAPVTNDTTPEITGDCTTGETVTVYVDGSAITPTAECTDATYSIIPDTNLTEGEHNVTATNTDDVGNESVPSPVAPITIDTTAPTTPEAPTVTGAPTDNTPDITGSCVDGDTVTAQIDGVDITPTVECIGGTYTITPDENLTDGDHNVTVTETDPAGNTTPPSPVTPITIDTTPPATPAAPTVTGAPADNTPDITGTCTDGDTVTAQIDGVNITPTVDCIGGTYTITPDDNLTDGDHTVTVIETDPVGNATPPSPVTPITIDTRGSISGTVTEDTTGDSNGDTPISHVTLRLLNSYGDVINTAVTDIDGKYIFPDLIAGEYTVVETQPEYFTNVSENEGGADNDKPNNSVIDSIDAIVDVNEDDIGNDFVDETERGMIIGMVEERLENGTINPIPNVGLTLLDNDGNTVATALTNNNGEYTFSNLVPGDYTVVESQPDGYYDIRENEGGADNDKPNNGVNNSIAATVSPGEIDMVNNFMEAEFGSLSGKVSQEFADGGLEALENVLLTLRRTDNKLRTASGTIVANTYTDEYGEYTFTGLVSGYYTVEETQPVGYEDVRENDGGSDGDLNNNKRNMISAKVGIGENDNDNDFIDRKIQATPTPAPAPEPKDQVTEITNQSATIHWKNVEGEFGYRIYSNGQLVAIVAADQTSYTLTNLESGTTHTYNVVALNGQGNMESQVIEFETKDSELGWLPAIYHILLN